MSILTNTTDTTPVATQRSIARFAERLARLLNNLAAAVIAQRERQANLTVLHHLSDRDLRDIGIARCQIPGGLAEAAKERALLQRELG